MTNSYQTAQNIKATDLVIRDLGYISLKFLTTIQNKEAFYPNKIKSNLIIWEKGKHGQFEKLNLTKIEKRLRKSPFKTCQRIVYLGEAKSVKCRLIIGCVPKEMIEEKLRKAKRTAQREGRALGKETIARIGLNLYVTNMSEDDLPLEKVHSLYRLRWQIELVFKVLKSIASIDKIKKVTRHRFECYLYGKLLWALLGWGIYWKMTSAIKDKTQAISINKMMKGFKRICFHLKTGSRITRDAVHKIDIFVESVFKDCMLERRKGKLSSIKIIEQLCKI